MNNKIQSGLFARFYTPGAFVADSWDVPIQSADPLSIRWPENAHSFEIIEKHTIKDKDGFELHGEKGVDGKMYYHPDSTIKTAKEILDREGESILYRNMDANGWQSVIFSRWGNWPQPYYPEKMVILTECIDTAEGEDNE